MHKDDYWGKRLADRIYEHNMPQMQRKLKKIYKQQEEQIQKAILDLYVSLLEQGELSTTALYQYGRYNQLLREISRITEDAALKQITLIQNTLERAYQEAFQKTSVALGIPAAWGITNTRIMEEVVNANFKGKNFSKRIWDNRNSLESILERQIQDIIGSGMNKDTAVKEVMRTTQTAFHNADRLIRTETMRVINDGQIKSYLAAGRTHGYYIVAKDDRLCKECNKIAKETKASPVRLEEMAAIHHPNCRCTVAPIVNRRKKKIEGRESNASKE